METAAAEVLGTPEGSGKSTMAAGMLVNILANEINKHGVFLIHRRILMQ